MVTGLVEGVKIDHLAWSGLAVRLLKDDLKSRQYHEAYYSTTHRGPTLLTDVEGEATSGQVLAIMGGFGSGKTLLLRALAGRPFDRKRFGASGRVTLNHGRYYRTAAWHRKIGFVQRSDELYAALTVGENVLFAGKLKARASHAEVERLLVAWRIDHIRNIKVGEIENEILSVDNRKRVACAIHTVHSPDVLFLDEPTIGLDPKRAEELIEDLQAFALQAHIIVIISINPSRGSVFKHFANLMLLCHGQTVFFGSVDAALRHFERRLGFSYQTHQNPSDYLIDIVTPDPKTVESHRTLDELRDRLVNAWREIGWDSEATNRGYEIGRAELKEIYWPNSWLEELCLLLQREWTMRRHEPFPFILSIAQRLLIFTLLAFIFFQINVYPVLFGTRIRFSLLLFITVNQASLILATTVPSITPLRPIVEREQLSFAYRTSTFHVARILTDLPTSLLVATVYAFIVYYITGLRQDGFIYFFVFWAIMQLEIFAVTGIGMFVSCLAKGRPVRDALSILIFLSMFMFGGYQVQNRLEVTWVLRWIQFLSPVYYAYIAFLQNEFRGNTIREAVSGDRVLADYGVALIGIWAAMAALFGIGLAYLVCAYFALRITIKPRRALF